MTNCVTIREYGKLLKGKHGACLNETLDEAIIPPACFNYLDGEFTSSKYTDEIDGDVMRRINDRDGVPRLQVKQYVGLIQTPDGTVIEILPKAFPRNGEKNGQERHKKTFTTMLRDYASDVKRLGGFAGLQHRGDMPLLEVIIGLFLDEVTTLVRKGVRSDYVRRYDNLFFQRGRLNVAGQLHHNLCRQERFSCEYDEYLLDRAENRLIRSALGQVFKRTRDSGNWRRCRELIGLFEGIPESTSSKRDLAAWRRDRNMTHYEPLEGWCRMLLNQEAPYPESGYLSLLSILFPMNVIFEHHVAAAFRRAAIRDGRGWRIHHPMTGESMLEASGTGRLFALKPDLGIRDASGNLRAVLDVKWKVAEGNRQDKYGIRQGDVYQGYAYGRYYGQPHHNSQSRTPNTIQVFLIYPDHLEKAAHLNFFHAYPVNTYTHYMLDVSSRQNKARHRSAPRPRLRFPAMI